MAHTIDYWYNEIIAEKERQAALNGLTSVSRVSIFRLMAWVFAFVAWLIETMFDKHKGEVTILLDKERKHQPEWYKERALEFQYGQAFNSALGQYANVGLSDAEIAAQKIIVQAAVTEVASNTGAYILRIKVARLVGGDLGSLTSPQLAAFVAYMAKVKDGGVKLSEESRDADRLKLDMDVFYDPLVLDGTGKRVDGTANTPVKDAIHDYLRNPAYLPFNGEYANTRLTDRLQMVEGVTLPVIKTAWAKYGLFAFAIIDEKYIPDSGFIRLDDADLTINWRPYV